MDIRTKRLNDEFKKSGLTQVELCEKTGINKGALSSYLSGRYFPKQQAVEKLANIFNVPITYLMGLDDEDKKEPFSRRVELSDGLVIAAHHDNDNDFTDEEWDSIIRFVEFVKDKKDK